MMGYRPNQLAPRHRHEPVEVRLLITDELVGYVCATCLDECAAIPLPPTSRAESRR